MKSSAERQNLRRWLIRGAHAAGLVVVALSLLFLADRFIQAGVWELARARGPGLIAAIVVAAVGYGLAGFLLSVGWVRNIRWCGEGNVPWALGLGIYGRTQIAKYLPGNVFHFVGRHVAGRNNGFGHLTMVWAALIEAAGLVSVAAGIAVIGAVLWLPLGDGLSTAVMALIAGLALLSPFVLSKAFVFLGRLLEVPIQGRNTRDIVTGLLPTYLLYALFFTVSATILWGLSIIIGEARPSVFAILLPTLAAAWLAGYLTPGAAAGLGVREAILAAALSDVIGVADATLLAVSYRGVTLLGDGVFFALSLALAPPARRVAG